MSDTELATIEYGLITITKKPSRKVPYASGTIDL